MRDEESETLFEDEDDKDSVADEDCVEVPERVAVSVSVSVLVFDGVGSSDFVSVGDLDEVEDKETESV